MPCSDGGPSQEQIFEERMMPAILCGVLTELEDRHILDGVFSEIDWDEVGCTEAYALGWWAEHKRRDAKRRALEAEQVRRRQLADKVRKKLTQEELDALRGSYYD